jgi:hypothetical protein
MDRTACAETVDPNYRTLYKLGGIAAWVVAALTVGEVIFFSFFPQPTTVDGWFVLLQNNKIIGLLDFWGLEVLMYIMFALVFLALYFALRNANNSLMAIALVFALLGIGIFFATNNPFSMLLLSSQHANAASSGERSSLLAAGQAILANTNQRAVGGFNMGLFLVYTAGLIVSVVMIRSKSFSRSTAYVGVLAYALSLTDYLREALTSSAIIALLVILPGALLSVIWFFMVGRKLYQLGSIENTIPG